MIFQTSLRQMLLASGLMAVSVIYLPSNAVAEPLKIIGPQDQLHAQTLQYGPTTATDTLWSIALKVRPDKSVNVYQVMAAIYDANRSAFLTNSYGSLEKKMMLTIPSKAEIQAISKRDAQRRAELKTQPKAKPVKIKPVTIVEPTLAEPVVPQVVKTEVVKADVAKTEELKSVKPAVEPMPEVLGDNVVVAEAIDDMTSLQSKLLSLTDTLARAEDQLDANQLDIQELRQQIQKKNELIATLEQSLVDSEQSRLVLTEKNRKLDQELSLLKEPIADVEQGNIWQQMMNNPLMLTLAAVLPAVCILLIVGWLLRRRAKNRAESTDNNLDIAAVGSSAVAATAIADVVADEESSAVANDVNADTEVPIDLDTLDDDNIESMLQQNKLIDEPEITETEQVEAEKANVDQQETNNEVDAESINAEQETDETLSTTDNDLASTSIDLNDDIDLDEPDLSQSDTEESLIQYASPDLQSLDLVAPDDVEQESEPDDDFNEILNQLESEPEPEQKSELAPEPEPEDDFNDILNQLEAEPAVEDVGEQPVVAEATVEEPIAATNIEQDKVADKIDALSANELVAGAMAQDNDDSDDDFWASLTQDSDDELDDISAKDKQDDIEPKVESDDSDEHIWTQFTDSDELNNDVQADTLAAKETLDSSEPSKKDDKFDDDLWAQYANEDNQDNDEFDFDDKQFSLGQGVSVEEALAALDKEELASSAAAVAEAPKAFEPETYIDIEKLISDADEDIADGDPYKEFKIPMDEIDTIMHGTAMVDVDDAENAINAKLDLASLY
ncbi:FimV/HubP family polar landmark protein [Shewanella marina]|uniref:FimV/HubP family polar landmark protein n=1 Tax=Shewanella marina TaxID=487319 RepID=UPI00046EF17E|nr:FimV/HubP family polar landmark protein [Shewanella marina]